MASSRSWSFSSTKSSVCRLGMMGGGSAKQRVSACLVGEFLTPYKAKRRRATQSAPVSEGNLVRISFRVLFMHALYLS